MVSGDISQLKGAQQVRKKSSGTVASLEFIRGLASLDVFIWHVLNTNIRFVHIPGLYWAVGWARESVIVFFVLSGYVIALSQQRFHRGAGQFFKARVKRILPIYLISLAVALLVGAAIHAPCTLWRIVGHLLFLQSFEGSLVPALATNSALWSLGTEFEFYMLFTLVLLLRKPGLMLVWWWAAIAGMLIRHAGYFSTGAEGLLLEFLGLSPCWLLGYFAAGFGGTRSLSLLQALVLFLMIPMVSWSDFGSINMSPDGYDDIKCYFFALLIVPLIHTLAVRQLYPEAKPFRQGWLGVLIIYLCLVVYALSHAIVTLSTMFGLAAIPALFFLLGYLFLPTRPVWPVNTEAFRRVALFLGGGSYALYAIHTPLMCCVIYFVSNRYLQLPLLVLLLVCAVPLLEYVVQPRMASWIDRVWRIGRRPNEQSPPVGPVSTS